MFITGAFFAKQVGVVEGLVDITGGFLSGRYFSTGQTEAAARLQANLNTADHHVDTATVALLQVCRRRHW